MFPTAHGVVSQGGNVVPPEPGDGYRYYRLRFNANNGRNTLGIAEVELRELPGGPNVAVGGVASASSVYAHSDGSWPASQAFDSNPDTYWSSHRVGGRSSAAGQPGAAASSEFPGTGFQAQNAFDGDPSTYWSSASGVTAASIGYDYGSGVTGADVTKYRIRARADAADGAPKDWTLEYSNDNISWSVAHTVTGETGWSNGERREFSFASVGAHRYWRINVTANNGRATLNIAEVEFIGYTWGTITLQYDLGVGNEKEIAQYAIRGRADASDGAPRDWVLEASNDLITWDELDTVTGETGWANGEQRVFTL